MKNREISIDTFSVLNSVGWALTLLRMAGVIATDWHAILCYWLESLGIGLLTLLIDIWTNKGGEK